MLYAGFSLSLSSMQPPWKTADSDQIFRSNTLVFFSDCKHEKYEPGVNPSLYLARSSTCLGGCTFFRRRTHPRRSHRIPDRDNKNTLGRWKENSTWYYSPSTTRFASERVLNYMVTKRYLHLFPKQVPNDINSTPVTPFGTSTPFSLSAEIPYLALNIGLEECTNFRMPNNAAR